jgi:putative inorganic carbon (HCO3(-)) transporter
MSLWLVAAWALVSGGLYAAAGTVKEGVLTLAWLCALSIAVLAVLWTIRQVARWVAVSSVVKPLDLQWRLPWLEVAACWIVQTELWLLLALTPFFMFPNAWTPVLGPLVILPWLARKLTRGCFTTRTLMDWPVVMMVLMLPASLWVSPALDRSWPKLYGILLGVAVFYAVANHVRGVRQAWVGGLVTALSGGIVSILALVGTDWHVEWLSVKSPVPQGIYRYLPRLISGVPGAAELGFHPNEVGAVLCLFAPLAAGLLLLGFGPPAPGTPKSRQWLLQGALSLALLVMVATAILTGSRSTWLGLAIALSAVLAFRSRRIVLALSLLVIVLVVWYMSSLRPELGPTMLSAFRRDLAWREEIWASALAMIRHRPWTGVGLNAFPVVANASYPLRSFAPQEVLELTHSHNAFLQVAVDLGIPGLVAYVAILFGFAGAAYSVCRQCQSRRLRAIAVGLACGMLGYHVYGLTDCMTLGAKPGLLIWVMWGLMAALANHTLPGVEFVDGERRWPSATDVESILPQG